MITQNTDHLCPAQSESKNKSDLDGRATFMCLSPANRRHALNREFLLDDAILGAEAHGAADPMMLVLSHCSVRVQPRSTRHIDVVCLVSRKPGSGFRTGHNPV
jgi:hypothetical protein